MFHFGLCSFYGSIGFFVKKKIPVPDIAQTHTHTVTILHILKTRVFSLVLVLLSFSYCQGNISFLLINGTQSVISPTILCSFCYGCLVHSLYRCSVYLRTYIDIILLLSALINCFLFYTIKGGKGILRVVQYMHSYRRTYALHYVQYTAPAAIALLS